MSLRICNIKKRLTELFIQLDKSETAQKAIQIVLFVLLVIVLLLMTCSPCQAQATSSHPLQYVEYREGNKRIDDAVNATMKSQKKTSAALFAMNAEFIMMEGWEDKYMSYLREANGFASSLAAGSKIYANGVMALMNLYKLTLAVKKNPEGIIATAAMNNIYMETLAEFIGIYYIVKEAVEKGGSDNLLDARARCQLLWDVEDKMEKFNRKLSHMVLSVGCCNMNDAWWKLTGHVYGNLARSQSFLDSRRDAWCRRARASWDYNH